MRVHRGKLNVQNIFTPLYKEEMECVAKTHVEIIALTISTRGNVQKPF